MHQDTVTAVAFDPTGRAVLTASKDRTARLWDTATGASLGPPLEHPNQVKSAALSPDGRMVLTGALDGRARLWDAVTGEQLGPTWPHGSDVVGVAFSADGRSALTGCYDQGARLWTVPTPLAGAVDQIVLWTQVSTGMELDGSNVFQKLADGALAERRQRLEALGGAPPP
jgi:WD40 repeat protein